MSTTGRLEASTTWQATIEMLTDWHVGTGAGIPGSIDRTVALAPNGLPFIPGSTLLQLWKDRAESIAQALDHDESGVNHGWQALVASLFGNEHFDEIDANADIVAPRPGMVSISAAMVAESLATVLCASADMRAAVRSVRAGVEMDPDTGAAKQDHLRFVEMSMGGMVLHAHAEIPADLPAAADALLHLALLEVDSVGGKRRRGAGRCRVSVSADIGAPDVEASLAALRAAVDAPTVDVVAIAASDMAPTGSDATWSVLELRLECEEPLLIPAATLGNVIEARDMVPGAVLLAAVSGACGLDVGALVADGSIVFTDATIEIDGQRSALVPHGLMFEKGTKGLGASKVYNTLRSAKQLRQAKRHRGSYVAVDAGVEQARAVVVSHQQRAHNRVDDQSQRPGDNSLFTVELFAAGSVLRSEIRVRDRALVERLERELSGRVLRLGSKTRPGYGRVRVEIAAPSALPRASYRADEAMFTVWCLSSVLARDDLLRPDPTARGLLAAIQTALRSQSGHPVTLEIVSSYAEADRIESWQQAWGLPRPSLIGVAAGSCALIRFFGDRPSEGAFAAVEASGIGERRAEGFGQVRFDPALLASDTIAAPAESADTKQVDTKSAKVIETEGAESGDPFVEVVAAEALRRWIDATASRVALHPTSVLEVADKSPSSSQIGTIRSLAEQIRKSSDLDSLKTWATGQAARQDGANIPWSKAALETVGDAAAKPDWAWEQLQRLAPLPRVPGSAALLKRLRPYAVRMVLSTITRELQHERRASEGHVPLTATEPQSTPLHELQATAETGS